MTGGRLRRVREFLDNEEAFCFTYGDGVSDIDVTALVAFHYSHGGLATVTATRPAGRFGALILTDDSAVKRFEEKPQGDQSWINGGFFVLDPTVIDYIPDDTTSWEEAPLMRLTSEGQLHAYKHRGFWQPMDTLRDKMKLNELLDQNKAPWKVWK